MKENWHEFFRWIFRLRTIPDVTQMSSFHFSASLFKVKYDSLRMTNCLKHDVAYFWIKLSLGVLGAIALCFLVIKRYRENPLIRRSWTIWLLDTSKQVAGMVFVHFINVFWECGPKMVHLTSVWFQNCNLRELYTFNLYYT